MKNTKMLYKGYDIPDTASIEVLHIIDLLKERGTVKIVEESLTAYRTMKVLKQIGEDNGIQIVHIREGESLLIDRVPTIDLN